MSRSVKLRHLPGRFAAGAFVLNSGLSKRRPDDATAASLHGMAVGTYPFLRSIPPDRFVRLLSTTEITLGAALLIPWVPALAAGAALSAFSAGLVGLYLRTPGLREKGSLRPTQQGVAIAKDVWMLGIGLGLVIDALTDDDR
ncbi:MAG TPA: hypothetical protein VGP57_06965 [Actinoplanes sp.]|jgi:hypothetical protein|nr:hypothetical protein [Actinoplanes sp.]